MASLQLTVTPPFVPKARRSLARPCFEGPRHSTLLASSTAALFGLSFDPRSFGCLVARETAAKVPKIGVVYAAWTRRSKSELAKNPKKKSWGQRTEMYMMPFLLNVFFSKRYIHAKVMHRATSKVISVASTNAKDLRNTLPSLIDNEACRVVGRLIAERCKDADVFAIAYDAKKDERIEGRLGIILDTIKENDIMISL